MANAPIDLLPLEGQLSDLATQIASADSNDEAWLKVESAAQALANGLRVKDGPVDNHTALGKTALPQTITTLLGLALHTSAIPDVAYTSPVFELLRVSANLCMEHDENRALLLEAGLPQAIVSLLEGYVDTIPPPPQSEPLPLSIPHLKVVRTAIGVLLNASVGYDPVKFRLISLEAALTVLKLSTAIYPPGSWLSASDKVPEETSAEIEESWSLRSGLSNWAWRTITELKDVKDETLQVLNQDALPLLTPPLSLFTPPYTTPSSYPFPPDSAMFGNLLHADFESLEESCTLIESLSLDVEDVRLSLARGFRSPAEHSGIPCLSTILDFIEKGDYSPLWRITSGAGDFGRERKEKAFDMCKAALIKSIVEVSGEEGIEDVLWSDSNSEKPGGEFICRMVEWIKAYVGDMDKGSGSAVGRDDLVICASLSLGNLVRKEQNTAILLAQPHSLAPVLTSAHLLSPDIDMKVKHGVMSLLKHLAQSSSHSSDIHVTLSKAEVIQRVSESGIWDEKADAMAEVVQVSAIGVVKHMCNANVENTFALVLPATSSSSATPTGLDQILALVKRSDSVPVKSEGTRVLVNVIKSLWSNDTTGSPLTMGSSPIANGTVNNDALLEKHRRRQAAMRRVLSPDCALALASLVGRSGKYPLLVNEGLVALSLLSIQKPGAVLVLKAISAPIQPEVLASPPSELPSASTSTSTASDVSSPATTTPSTQLGPGLPAPRTALQMLINVLKNVDNPANFQPEVRINVCSLLLQIGKNTTPEEFLKVKETMKPVVERVYESNQSHVTGKEEMLSKSLKRVLDTWA